MSRLETGPYRPAEDDWMGVFIRGDDAFGYALALRKALTMMPVDEDVLETLLCRNIISGVAELLESCDEGKPKTDDQG